MRARVLLFVVTALALGLATPIGVAAPDRPEARPPVRPVMERVALADAAPAADPTVREVSGKRFAMVAVRWTGAPPAGARIQARREDGRWGDWIDLETQDGPDTGTTAGSEPIWVGHSTAVRVRSNKSAELSVVLIDPIASPADATLAAVPRPTVITRAAWGADESIRTRCFARQGIGVEYSSTVKAAVIHHTAGTNDYTAAESAQIVRGIYAYHAIDNDWCDIGYNVLVDKYGQVFEGRFGGLERPVWGAHAGGFNEFTFGVSMLGTFTTVAPTPEQLESVSRMVAWKLAGSYRDPNGQVTLVSGGGGTSKYPIGTPVTLPTIFAHRDVGATECPGDLGYQELPAIRQRVTQLMGDWRSSPIQQRWQSTGADDGPLGGVYELERAAANGGLATVFLSGGRSVYWSPTAGAHIVEGAIRDKWREYNAESGRAGYPITDESSTPDGVGRFNHFEAGASIYWTPSTGAHLVYGGIRSAWQRTGWEGGPCGYPMVDESGTPDGVGRYNHFTKGCSIYWSPSTDAHLVYGLIRQAWQRTGWETGPCGYPTVDETSTPDGVGRYNHFTKGCSIYWSPSTDAHVVYGSIRQRWSALGWEWSYLGYPISDEYSVPGGRRSDFQHGYIVWNASTGAVTDRRY